MVQKARRSWQAWRTSTPCGHPTCRSGAAPLSRRLSGPRQREERDKGVESRHSGSQPAPACMERVSEGISATSVLSGWPDPTCRWPVFCQPASAAVASWTGFSVWPICHLFTDGAGGHVMWYPIRMQVMLQPSLKRRWYGSRRSTGEDFRAARRPPCSLHPYANAQSQSPLHSGPCTTPNHYPSPENHGNSLASSTCLAMDSAGSIQ